MAKRPGFTAILASAALALHLFAGLSFIFSSSATYDETVHLSSGYSYLETGRYAMNIMDHPPLAEMLCALPLAFMNLKSFTAHPYFANLMPYHYGDLFLYENTAPPGRLLNTARSFGFLAWTSVFAFFIWSFASRLESGAAAAFSLAVFSLMPVFISNDALVTTDAAAAAFYFASFAAGWYFTEGEAGQGKPGGAGARLWRRAALAGVLSGLALVSKFSMFIVPPMVAALWLADNRLSRRMPAARLAGHIAVYAAACLLAVALVYKFDLGLYWKGLYATLTRLDQGRSSFAFGSHSVSGVWWYFPAALLVKTPLPALGAAAAGVWLAVKNFRRGYLWLLVPPAAFFAAALSAKVQIGYRHIMPVMPFLAVLAGLALARIPGKKGAWLASGLVILNAVSVLRVHPYYLAYFNEAAGGPARGYRLLTDSNLDWGQDVRTLARYLATRGNPPVVFSYFGVARPESAGISYVPLGVVSNVELKGAGAQVCSMKEVLLAVSATNLQGTYYADKDTYGWLKDRKPAFDAGHSIFLYDLTSDGPGLRRLAALFDREGRNAEADCLYERAGRAEKAP
ncbi:MAG: hypothetical protein M0025_02775 [Elusimicrobia bacterium]|nr:hypothetical protein [Elusimicrobiota bacterium]